MCTIQLSAALSGNCHCQVYPSEYAYHKYSVYRSERASALCREYPTSLTQAGASPEDYFHCDGTPLQLTDSDIGSEQYTNSDYYHWTAGSNSQLLFIFPTRINLTNITLHYFSNSVRGLPRLRFYAVPDDFNVWKSPTSSYSYVDVAEVPQDEEPAGHRNVSVGFNVTTMKLLMFKFHSTYAFAVSEVEFFNHTCK